MNKFFLIIWVLLTVVALGCSAGDNDDRWNETNGDSDADGGGDTDADSDGDTDADSDGDADSDADGDGLGCSGMDILFVIDDSGSMMEEQTNLANNFPKFIEVLDQYQTSSGSGINYRIGVTTTGVTRSFKQKIIGMAMPMTSVGPDGKLLGQNTNPAPNCGLTEPWLEGPGTNVAQTFSCMAKVGTSGSGTEMPFAAMEGALGETDPFKSAPGGPNEGFYRKNADSLLVVVMITDEDDCSIDKGGTMILSLAGGADCNENTSTGLYSAEEMKDFLDVLTGGTGRYVVVGIAGPNACSSPFGDALNAKRVQKLVSLCADYGFFGNICAGDLWVSLQDALEVMKTACDDMGPVI
ncbi:MAG: hypothetical protein GY854_05825 [Deltaproteobacteria bacterium]|nr:hypothetical protein [Deltaproteobacteria bacterium]